MDINMVECLSRLKHHINRGPLLYVELTLLKLNHLSQRSYRNGGLLTTSNHISQCGLPVT